MPFAFLFSLQNKSLLVCLQLDCADLSPQWAHCVNAVIQILISYLVSMVQCYVKK